MLRQKPQWSAEEVVSVSQPFAEFPSQSAWPSGHWDTAHCPSSQLQLPADDVQSFEQEPHLDGSARMLVSQPSVESPLQSMNPSEQLSTEHFAPVHFAVAFGSSQRAAHPPQLAGSAATCVSQPSGMRPLQSE